MSWHNKPVWTEGMFLRPQHFQQFERAAEAQLDGRVADLRSYGWGLTDLEFDEGLLKSGKISLLACAGVFDDGTPFRIPAHAQAPMPLEVTSDLRDKVIHLCLPARRAGAADVALDKTARTETRFVGEDVDTPDTVYGAPTRAAVKVGRLQVLLRPETEPLEGYSTLPVARVIERRADGSVELDRKAFIPTVMAHRASPVLRAFVSELDGILHQRGEAIAGRMGTPGGKGGGDYADFLMLMIVNRAEAAIKHLAALPALHPADLYLRLLELGGELATISGLGNRPSFLPIYNHRAIHEGFVPLMEQLRTALNFATAQKAVPIPLEERNYGIRVGVVHDATLFSDAAFVLAARAAVDDETIRANLPRRVKIGSVDHIRDMVMRQLSGVEISPMAAEPRQIPFRANTVYFAVNTRSEHWQPVREARAVAVHVAGEIPNLELELWAIRGQSS